MSCVHKLFCLKARTRKQISNDSPAKSKSTKEESTPAHAESPLGETENRPLTSDLEVSELGLSDLGFSEEERSIKSPRIVAEDDQPSDEETSLHEDNLKQTNIGEEQNRKEEEKKEVLSPVVMTSTQNELKSIMTSERVEEAKGRLDDGCVALFEFLDSVCCADVDKASGKPETTIRGVEGVLSDFTTEVDSSSGSIGGSSTGPSGTDSDYTYPSNFADKYDVSLDNSVIETGTRDGGSCTAHSQEDRFSVATSGRDSQLTDEKRQDEARKRYNAMDPITGFRRMHGSWGSKGSSRSSKKYPSKDSWIQRLHAVPDDESEFKITADRYKSR